MCWWYFLGLFYLACWIKAQNYKQNLFIMKDYFFLPLGTEFIVTLPCVALLRLFLHDKGCFQVMYSSRLYWWNCPYVLHLHHWSLITSHRHAVERNKTKMFISLSTTCVFGGFSSMVFCLSRRFFSTSFSQRYTASSKHFFSVDLECVSMVYQDCFHMGTFSDSGRESWRNTCKKGIF